MRNVLKFIFIADSKKHLRSFFPWWKILAFILMVIFILWALFPKYLLINILINKQPAEVALSYLQAFEQNSPRDTPLMLALIEQQIGLGQLKKAENNMTNLKNTNNPQVADMNHQLDWLDYLMVRFKTYQTKMNTAERIAYLRQLRQMAAAMANTPLEPQQLEILAKDNLSLAQALVSLKIYNKLLDQNALNTPIELGTAGSVAMQNNAHIDSAKFYWAAYLQATQLNEKKQYALKTIQALWAGNFIDKALDTASKLPDSVINERNLLLYLSRLAIAGNRLDLAEQYALKANLYSNNDTVIRFKKTPYDDEAIKLIFQIYSYNAKIKAAYQWALIAVSNKPDDLTWHAKLAKTATWIGDYNTAMKEWLYIVKHEKNMKIIKNAISIARTLGYFQVLAEMLKINIGMDPNDVPAILELARVQHRIGASEQALLTLQKLNIKHPNQIADEYSALIYQDLRQWDNALKTWQKIDKKYGYNTKSAMAQATIYYTKGQFEQAVEILKKGIPSARKSDKEFWETSAHLAWIINDRQFAILSYSQDLTDTSHLLRLIELEKLVNPQHALNYGLKGWAQSQNPLFFFDVLYLAQQLNQWKTISNVYTNLTAYQLKTVKKTPLFWKTLADLYAGVGMEPLQREVLIQGIMLHPGFQLLKSDLLWLVTTNGELQRMKILLETWYEQNLINSPELWHTFAESLGVLNQVYTALSLYQHHLLQDAQNFQIIMDYTNLLQKARRYRQSYDVRQYLWDRIVSRFNQHIPLDEDAIRTLSQLSSYFVSGTYQVQLLNMLMKHPTNSQNLNMLLNWLVQKNYFDLMTFFKTYYMNNKLPARIEIYLALVKNDLPALQKILQQPDTTSQPDRTSQPDGTWPRGDYINAAVRLENTPLANELAFSELSERPLAHEIYEEFTKFGLLDANNARLSQEYEQFIDLVGPRTKFDTKRRLTNTWAMRPYISEWEVRSNNSSIVNVPSQDFQTGVKLDQRIHRGNVTYQLGYRKALNAFSPLGVDLNYLVASRLDAKLMFGFNQEIYQTSYLRIGGVQDRLGLRLNYNVEQYDVLQTELQGFNYYSQDRHYLANGYLLHGEYSHRFWITYPDFTVGVFGNIYGFNRNGSYGGDVTTLFPALTPQQQSNPTLVANTQAANYALLVPDTYKEAGCVFSFGNTILDYTHDWRPYFWGTVFYNTLVGTAYDIRLGVNGSVWGQDSLLFYAERGISPAVANSVNEMIGLRYTLFY